MPYGFLYDLSAIPRSLFKQVVEIAYEKQLYKLVSKQAKSLVKTFKVDEITGLNFTDAISLVEDLIEVQATNILQKDGFKKAQRKVLLLPHCTRKYMDKNCKAEFNPEIPTYNCQKCSPDCLINKANALGKTKGYDVYVIPGGSCMEKILRKGKYEAAVGVACGMELKLGLQVIKKLGIPGQGLFLTKNGCANTSFNLENLEKILAMQNG